MSHWRLLVRDTLLQIWGHGSAAYLLILYTALVEPLAVAWHAVNLSAFESNQSVLILGGGPIGLAVVQALVARNATKIILSEPSRARAEFARRLGAHHILNPFAEDIPSKVRELTGADSEGKGGGVNIVYDAAGVQKGLEQAARCIRARGLLVNIAVWKDTATIVPNIFAFREIRYMGIATYVEGDFKAVIDAISSGKTTFFLWSNKIPWDVCWSNYPGLRVESP